ncbi:hypothetical protein PSPO01_13826 [Paraphaeosphaeria sporulosa]
MIRQSVCDVRLAPHKSTVGSTLQASRSCCSTIKSLCVQRRATVYSQNPVFEDASLTAELLRLHDYGCIVIDAQAGNHRVGQENRNSNPPVLCLPHYRAYAAPRGYGILRDAQGKRCLGVEISVCKAVKPVVVMVAFKGWSGEEGLSIARMVEQTMIMVVMTP